MNSLFIVGLPLTLSALMVACISPLQRWILKGKSSPMAFLSASQGCLALGFCLVYIAKWGFTTPQHLEVGFWTPVLVCTLVNYGIQYGTAKAMTYKKGEVSLLAPLSAMTPGLVMIVASLLGEYPQPIALLGIAFMILGSWIILSPKDANHWWEYLGPLYRLRLITHYRTLSTDDKEKAKAVWLVFGVAFLGTIGLVCNGLFTRRGGDIQGMWLGYIVLWALLATGSMAQYFLLTSKKDKAVGIDVKRFYIAAICYAILVVVATAIESPVYFETFIAYVGTLSRLRILFTILIVLGLSKIPALKNTFEEEDFKKRFFAAVLISVGALLIAQADLPEHVTTAIERLGF